MAIPFLNNINLDDNQLLNAKLHVTSSVPTAAQGQIYFDSTTLPNAINTAKYYDGSAWISLVEHTFNNGTYINLTETGTDATRTLTADLSATGTPDATKYLRGDNTWSAISTIPGTYTFDVDADTGTPQTIDSGDTLLIDGGTYISTEVSAVDTVTIDHDLTSRSDTTSTDAPGYGGTFEAVTSVTTNATGHVTAIDVSTVTIPASDNTDNYVDSISFNTGSGVLTLGRTGALADLTQDLDGRYLELSGGTMTGDIAMGSNSITGLADPTNPQDAATRAYVDGLVEGGLTFKDGFNANTGAIDGGGNLTSGATRVAISVGDYYVVTTAGDFYGDSSIPLTVGDSVICKTDAAQGASTSANWVIVQGDEGVVDLTSGNGGTSTGNALTSNTNARGAVTVNSFAYGGTTNVGHVPSGGSATTFLRGDGTWVTPTDTNTVDDVTASTTNDLLGISVSPTTGNVVVGLDINGLTAVIGPKSPSEMVVWDNLADQNYKITLANLAIRLQDFVSKRINIGNGVDTSIDITSTDHGLGTDSSDFMIQLVEVSSGETVYADVTRGASGLVTIDFATAPATNAIKVLIQRIIQ